MPGIRLVVSNYVVTNIVINLDQQCGKRNADQPLDLRPEICTILREAADTIEAAKELLIDGDINDIYNHHGVKVGDWSIELLSPGNDG